MIWLRVYGRDVRKTESRFEQSENIKPSGWICANILGKTVVDSVFSLNLADIRSSPYLEFVFGVCMPFTSTYIMLAKNRINLKSERTNKETRRSVVACSFWRRFSIGPNF